MSVFEYLDYKKFLKAEIESHSNERGYQTKLATSAGCQRAFLSQVLHGKVHLTFDHAAGLCEFWNMLPNETDYFFELLQLSRAGSPKLKSHVMNKLNIIKSQHSDLSVKFKSTKSLTHEQQSHYYSSWMYAAIHVLTSIEGFRKPKIIAMRLHLKQSLVSKILGELKTMGILDEDSTGYFPSEKNLFLPRQSAMTYMLHSNWRIKALEDIQNDEKDSIHYTSLHALSIQDVEKLKQEISSFLKSAKSLVEASNEEEMICLNLDLFKV